MIEPTKAARRPSRRRSDGSRRSDGDGDGDARASARRVDGGESVRSALDSTRFHSIRLVSRTTRKNEENEIKTIFKTTTRRDGFRRARGVLGRVPFVGAGRRENIRFETASFFLARKRSSRIPASRDRFRLEPTPTSTSTARERRVRVRDAAVRQSHAYAPRSTRSVQRRIRRGRGGGGLTNRTVANSRRETAWTRGWTRGAADDARERAAEGRRAPRPLSHSHVISLWNYCNIVTRVSRIDARRVTRGGGGGEGETRDGAARVMRRSERADRRRWNSFAMCHHTTGRTEIFFCLVARVVEPKVQRRSGRARWHLASRAVGAVSDV